MFDDVICPQFLKQCDPTIRNRHYGSVPVFWAWVSQILDGNSPCSKAVSRIQTWCKDLGIPIPSSDTSSYCKGRIRMPESFVNEVSRKVQMRRFQNSSEY